MPFKPPFEQDNLDNSLDIVDYYIEEEDWDTVLSWAVDHHNDSDPDILSKVIECYEHCVEQNMPLAALNLGTFYYNGRIVEQDYKEAYRLYKIAADAGLPAGLTYCGYCFYYGRHQKPDYAEAFKYFALGAMLHNDANCLYKLGDLFLNGYGVGKNENYAFLLYERSLLRSHDEDGDKECIGDAQFRVGKCLLRGIGTEKNLDEAHMLLSFALLNFYRRAGTDIFAAKLIKDTKDLIAEAQKELDRKTAADLESWKSE